MSDPETSDEFCREDMRQARGAAKLIQELATTEGSGETVMIERESLEFIALGLNQALVGLGRAEE